MAEKLILGIDIGTSGCKSILVGTKGEVIASETVEYPLYVPNPGWSEQDPEDWWKGTVESIRSVLRKSGASPEQVSCIGLSGQMHGMVALDAEGKVIRRAILWNDQRTAVQCREIVEKAGGLEGLLGLTNNDMLPGYTGGKILWLREEEPEHYEKVRMFLNPKDYIRYLLTGEYATEVSDASGTGLFNVEHRRWSKELLSLLDIPLEFLPKCYESTDMTGRLAGSASEALGLPAGIPVYGGGGDAVVQTTGTGLIREGVLGTIIGTSGVVAMGLNSYQRNKGGKLQVFCNNGPGLWHCMGVTLCAGGSYRWFRDTLCRLEKEEAARLGKDTYTILEEEARLSPPGSRNLVFLPYLTGERCPYPDPNARGAFVGLTLQHNHGDMTRSVMEGVVYSMYQVWELMAGLDDNLRVEEVRTSGGGSLSPIWRQIQADVFQIPVRTVSGSGEGGAYGAALVAGTGLGIWSNLEEAVQVIKVETETLPRPEYKNLYRDLYQVYAGLYPALKTANDRLHDIK